MSENITTSLLNNYNLTNEGATQGDILINVAAIENRREAQFIDTANPDLPILFGTPIKVVTQLLGGMSKVTRATTVAEIGGFTTSYKDNRSIVYPDKGETVGAHYNNGFVSYMQLSSNVVQFLRINPAFAATLVNTPTDISTVAVSWDFVANELCAVDATHPEFKRITLQSIVGVGARICNYDSVAKNTGVWKTVPKSLACVNLIGKV